MVFTEGSRQVTLVNLNLYLKIPFEGRNTTAVYALLVTEGAQSYSRALP